MPSPLLETKLFIPTRRSAHLPRARLGQQLSRAAAAKLTLVSAPPGFGKTTLLATWLAGLPDRQRSAAWVSLDQSDNTPRLFWSYVITALQRLAPLPRAGALALLDLDPTPMDAVLGTLLNEIAAVQNDLVLVLDDYHVIDQHDVHEQMAYLLEHLPPQLHVVIASRADPPLSLARLRARGELVEIRAADLRLTRAEVAAYLNGLMGLDLEPKEVALLEERTEGWIAALQLAALSMQGRHDAASFVAGFAGDDRYIVDYLVEEVLQRQPEHVRAFLLQTSILERLIGSLCDAVTGQADGKATLESLDRGNLFVVCLDAQRRWYRYHHLFEDVLRAHLLDEQSERVPELHRRASAWHARNGQRSEAIRHALAATDYSRAADLVELEIPVLRRNRQEATLRNWLTRLPDDVLRQRPVLSNIYAGALLATGELDGVDARLRDAERWLSCVEDAVDNRPAPEGLPADAIVVDKEQFRQLAGSVAVHRAGYALALGKPAETVSYARRALDLAPEDDHLARGGAAGFLGLVAWGSGDLETAQQMYATATASLRRAGHISDTFGLSIALAEIRLAQGRLGEAMSICEQATRIGIEHGPVPARGTADMYVAMSEVFRERNDLAAATRCLETSHELGEYGGLPQNQYRSRVAMARIREAEGDLDGALDLLQDAERVYMSDFFPNVRPVPALRARVLVRQRKLTDAQAWVRARGLSAGDELSYVHEFEHITLARLLLAQGSTREASALLERLLRSANQGARTGSAIEILVLLALAAWERDDTSGARTSLGQALELAQPEGYVRLFADEGQPIVALLEAAVNQRETDYVRRLLAATGKADGSPRMQEVSIEPLSDRELEVLRLLGTDLDGPDIARELVVSLNTLRTHTRNIFGKLGVNNRRAAVRRAEELELFGALTGGSARWPFRRR